MTNSTVTVGGITFSDADIEALKSGEQLGGSLKNGLAGPITYTPQSSTPIQSGVKDIKPRIRSAEGEVIDQKVVTRPNMQANNSNHAAEMLRLEVEQEAIDAEQKELRAFMEPKKLRAEIEYLTRTVKRLERSLKSLQKEQDVS